MGETIFPDTTVASESSTCHQGSGLVTSKLEVVSEHLKIPPIYTSAVIVAEPGVSPVARLVHPPAGFESESGFRDTLGVEEKSTLLTVPFWGITLATIVTDEPAARLHGSGVKLTVQEAGGGGGGGGVGEGDEIQEQKFW